jgi:hypothetical protein
MKSSKRRRGDALILLRWVLNSLEISRRDITLAIGFQKNFHPNGESCSGMRFHAAEEFDDRKTEANESHCYAINFSVA